ncbi:MAG: hypothetical protein LM591_01690 [Candidatus Korarchaeum sp.]|jgi:hypothetical protein|nr:hypothetical protein [Candidatus Korarchaeum sp.]
MSVDIEFLRPWEVTTRAEKRGSFLEVENKLSSIWKVRIRNKNYIVPVTMTITSRGIFVTYLSNKPDGDGYSPIARCYAVDAAKECLEDIVRRYPDFEFNSVTIGEIIEECVSERLKKKIGAFGDVRIECGAIKIE